MGVGVTICTSSVSLATSLPALPVVDQALLPPATPEVKPPRVGELVSEGFSAQRWFSGVWPLDQSRQQTARTELALTPNRRSTSRKPCAGRTAASLGQQSHGRSCPRGWAGAQGAAPVACLQGLVPRPSCGGRGLGRRPGRGAALSARQRWGGGHSGGWCWTGPGDGWGVRRARPPPATLCPEAHPAGSAAGTRLSSSEFRGTAVTRGEEREAPHGNQTTMGEFREAEGGAGPTTLSQDHGGGPQTWSRGLPGPPRGRSGGAPADNHGGPG